MVKKSYSEIKKIVNKAANKISIDSRSKEEWINIISNLLKNESIGDLQLLKEISSIKESERKNFKELLVKLEYILRPLNESHIILKVKLCILYLEPNNLNNLLNCFQINSIEESEELTLIYLAYIESHIKKNINIEELKSLVQNLNELHNSNICNHYSLNLFRFLTNKTKENNIQRTYLQKNISKSLVYIISRSDKETFKIKYLLLCRSLYDFNPELEKELIKLLSNLGLYSEAIQRSEEWLNRTGEKRNRVEELISNYFVLRSNILSGGQWEKVISTYEDQIQLLRDIIKNHILNADLIFDENFFIRSLSMTSINPYISDTPKELHNIRKELKSLYRSNIIINKNIRQPNRKLKIGYISECFRRHSITWLCRWLYKYHDREKVEIYSYSLKKGNDDLYFYIQQQSDFFYDFSNVEDKETCINKIRENKIDIIVDLDSLTSAKACSILISRVAPIQLTWLGSDASGLPNVDYFIADNHSLPQNAETYYSTKILRLEGAYLGIDGFEIGIPNISRKELNIPENSVVFYSSQTAYKRNPEITRLQLEIIKHVPNSYFIIRGLGDQENLYNFFVGIANEIDVDINKIRFLGIVDKEETHRANLSIADVVLDTYPYNGATTSLETLWMGIPIVTRVGQQFAARNTYTFLKEIGVEEGISWNENDYVDWGIKFGRNKDLREKVSEKILKSKGISNLWSGLHFAQKIENLYFNLFHS